MTNNGTVNLTGTTVSGVSIVNTALITGHGTIAGSDGLTNSTSAHIIQGAVTSTTPTPRIDQRRHDHPRTGYQFNASTGGAVTNNATINLNGGTLNATLTNTVNGTISGPGTIAGTLANSGMIDLPTGTLNTPPSFTNAGVIALGSNGMTSPGAAITNNGTLEGVGKVLAAVTDNKTIQSAHGTLWFATAPTNTSAGTIIASAGGKILITAVPSSNAGTIILAGGTFDVNGGGLTNGSAGHITGYGTFRGAALTNNGTVTFTNPAGACLRQRDQQRRQPDARHRQLHRHVRRHVEQQRRQRVPRQHRHNRGVPRPVTGSAAFTGAGLKIFESSLASSVAAIASEVGDTIVDVPATVTAGRVNEDALHVNGTLSIAPTARRLRRVE